MLWTTWHRSVNHGKTTALINIRRLKKPGTKPVNYLWANLLDCKLEKTPGLSCLILVWGRKHLVSCITKIHPKTPKFTSFLRLKLRPLKLCNTIRELNTGYKDMILLLRAIQGRWRWYSDPESIAKNTPPQFRESKFREIVPLFSGKEWDISVHCLETIFHFFFAIFLNCQLFGCFCFYKAASKLRKHHSYKAPWKGRFW